MVALERGNVDMKRMNFFAVATFDRKLPIIVIRATDVSWVNESASFWDHHQLWNACSTKETLFEYLFFYNIICIVER